MKFQQVRLSLAHAHARAYMLMTWLSKPDVHAAMRLSDQLRREARQAIAWNVQMELPRGQYVLWATAVTMALAAFALIRQVMAQFGRRYALGKHFLQLPGQAGFAKDRLGILVLNLDQQPVDQHDWEWVWRL